VGIILYYELSEKNTYFKLEVSIKSFIKVDSVAFIIPSVVHVPETIMRLMVYRGSIESLWLTYIKPFDIRSSLLRGLLPYSINQKDMQNTSQFFCDFFQFCLRFY
jgi:hypothetical protein